MAAEIQLYIDGTSVQWERVWVHLQRPDPMSSYPYSAIVPIEFAVQVFDPHRTKPEHVSWRRHIGDHIDEFGTFVASAYFDNMSAVTGGDRNPTSYEWVIATVEEVSEENRVIVLSGKAVRFCR